MLLRSRTLTLWLLLGCCLLNAPTSFVSAEEKASADETKDSLFIQTSRVIPASGSVHLANGNGDIDAAGACKADIEAHCSDVGPGEGRLSWCLTTCMRDQKKGNAAGRKVGEKCIEELAEFKIDRSTNINKDTPLARACKESALKHCADHSDEKNPGSTLGCLRSKKPLLTPVCKEQVFRTQEEATQDYRTDYQLYTACKADVKGLCADVERGAEVECLESKRRDVSWNCQSQLFRTEQEAGDDIRLSTRLFTKCFLDYRKFCKEVEPGHMQVQECLEDHLDDAGFSAECKEELDNVIAQRVSDFRLNTVLREACEGDLKDHCGATLKDMDADDKTRSTALNCLQQYRDEIQEEKCKAEVHRMMQRAARDIRFDQVLADSCYEDRQKYCNDVKLGSARVIRCLQDHRDSIHPQCAAALFDHELRMAEDIDFKYPMKKACAWEMNSFCKDIPHGHARIVRCLQEHLEDSEMGAECRAEVTRDVNRQSQDYRLNWRLNDACKADIATLCAQQCSSVHGAPCGGLVLRCLRDQQDNITDQACKDEVFYYELMEVSDFRNDVILAEACRNDVEAYCKAVEPGEGRVHACLRFNKDKISDRCRKEELKLAALEYRDIRLRPKLNKLCSEEKAVYCKDIKPGKARVVKCLIENMAQPNFGEECKEELQKREEVMKNDYRYDVGVLTSCASDVDVLCAEAKAKLRGNATVLKCLAENFLKVSEACQVEMSRAVRLALWDYKRGAALTAACDVDIEDKCPKGSRSKAGAAFTIGAVGRCLSKALVQGQSLQPKCRGLVLVAAPKDMRSYFQSSSTSGLVMQKLQDLQQAAGLDGLLLEQSGGASEASTVTVTGWMALVCVISLVVVTVGGAFLLLRRLSGPPDKPNTLHVKMGDA